MRRKERGRENEGKIFGNKIFLHTSLVLNELELLQDTNRKNLLLQSPEEIHDVKEGKRDRDSKKKVMEVFSGLKCFSGLTYFCTFPR